MLRSLKLDRRTFQILIHVHDVCWKPSRNLLLLLALHTLWSQIFLFGISKKVFSTIQQALGNEREILFFHNRSSSALMF